MTRSIRLTRAVLATVGMLLLASGPLRAAPVKPPEPLVRVSQGVDHGQPGIWVVEPIGGSVGAHPHTRRYFVPQWKVLSTTHRSLLDSRVLRTEQQKRVLDQILEKDMGAPVISTKTEEQKTIADQTVLTRGAHRVVQHVHVDRIQVVTTTTPYTVRRFEDYETRFLTTARNTYRIHAILSWPDPVTGKIQHLAQDTVSAPVVEQSLGAWVKGQSVLARSAGQSVSRSRHILSQRDSNHLLPPPKSK